jgi:glutathione S-transferase
MLERKGIEHEVVDLLPGFHPLQLRAAGFRGGTVPALRIQGRRVLGSRRISRALEGLRTDPPLFPADPDGAAVADAERWGEEVLQPVPRRIFRWGAAHSQEVRRWIAADVVGMPAPGLLAAAQAPIAWRFAHAIGANDARVRSDVAGLPTLLDRVGSLIAAGTIGGEDPNAADYQIATAVRVLLAFEDLRAAVADRPAGEHAVRVLPRYPEPIPSSLPAEWVAPLRSGS